MTDIFHDYNEAETLFLDKIKDLSDRKLILDKQIQYYMRYLNNFMWRNPSSEDFYIKIFKLSPLARTWTAMSKEIDKFKRHLRLAQIHFKKVKPDAREEFSDKIDMARSVKIREVVDNALTKGHNGLYPCPFHNEKAPSMKIYPKTNSFYCFGCNVGGDVIKFVMLYHDLDFKEAIEYLV